MLYRCEVDVLDSDVLLVNVRLQADVRFHRMEHNAANAHALRMTGMVFSRGTPQIDIPAVSKAKPFEFYVQTATNAE